MEKELKCNFLKVNQSKNTFEVHEKEPPTNWAEFVIQNATIKFKEDSTIEVFGEKIEWSFAFHETFVEDLKREPKESYTALGYKTILDRLKGIKKPYVKSGWYKINKTTPYHCTTSNWFVIL
jgi:hypothetical protein